MTLKHRTTIKIKLSHKKGME
uniref:Uncharacterized protein n=1 Tax=Rhizophora mucronata TaxID=61149 RepID=A0A2P2L9K6_RHIMU